MKYIPPLGPFLRLVLTDIWVGCLSGSRLKASRGCSEADAAIFAQRCGSETAADAELWREESATCNVTVDNSFGTTNLAGRKLTAAARNLLLMALVDC